MNFLRYTAWLFFGYNGRLSRLPYVVALLGAILALGMSAILFEDPHALADRQWTSFSICLAILIVWTSTALLVKRLRDVGLRWAWVLLLCMPTLQIFVLIWFAIPKGSAHLPKD